MAGTTPVKLEQDVKMEDDAPQVGSTSTGVSSDAPASGHLPWNYSDPIGLSRCFYNTVLTAPRAVFFGDNLRLNPNFKLPSHEEFLTSQLYAHPESGYHGDLFALVRPIWGELTLKRLHFMRDARDLVRCWKLQMQMPTRGKGPNSYIARVPLDSSAPTSTTSGFIAWFESFCAQRGVAQLLRLQQPHPGNADSMTLTYSYIPNEGRDSCPGYSAQFIVPMYHGTTFYGCLLYTSPSPRDS